MKSYQEIARAKLYARECLMAGDEQAAERWLDIADEYRKQLRISLLPLNESAKTGAVLYGVYR